MESRCGSRWSSTYAGLLLLLLSAPCGSTENVAHHRTNQIQTAAPESAPLNNEFDWRLVQEVVRREQKNTIFSPFSIKLLLTLLYEASGQNSTTRRELSRALAGTSMEKNRQLYREFLESSMKENTDYEFNIGTRIFVDQSIANVTQDYMQLVESCYKTSIAKVLFSEGATTATEINAWCSEMTRGRLRDLVDEETVKNSGMIIANVLFLKASWRNSFLEELNRKEPFYVSANQSAVAEFMEQTDFYQYANEMDMQLEMLRMPYKGRQFSMVLVLPYANTSLDTVISSMTAAQLSRLESRMQREEIVVVIPKFKFDYGTSLNDVLINLGVSELFTRRASLPQLSGGDNSNLEVSKILQKAGIEVNEKGTLAVAATEIQLVNKFGIDDSPTQFVANRPFLFYIKDEESDAILFVGKVINPAAAAT